MGRASRVWFSSLVFERLPQRLVPALQRLVPALQRLQQFRLCRSQAGDPGRPLLCKSKDRTVAQYALRDIHKPLGIAEFRTQDLPAGTFNGTLPTIEGLGAELDRS